MKDVIENMKNNNKKRKIKKKTYEIYYENICDQFNLLELMTWKLKTHLSTNNNEIIFSDIPIIYIMKDYEDNYRITLRIIITDVFYLFEFDISDFSHDEIDLLPIDKYKNELDKEIFAKLLKLYKYDFIDGVMEYYKTNNLKCSLNQIELENLSLKIEIESDRIIFNIPCNKYLYVLEGQNKYENCVYIDEQCHVKFKEILKKISVIGNLDDGKGLEFLFRLLKKNKKVESLVKRILNKQRSAVNIFFGHILLHTKEIKKYELDIILGKITNARNIIEKIEKSLLRLFSVNNMSESSYFLKICLVLEIEDLMTECKQHNDFFYNSLNDIIKLIKSKNQKDEKTSISLVIHEISNIYINDILKYNHEVIFMICKIISVLTGLDTALIFRNNPERFSKDEAISNLKLCKNNVEHDSKIIRRRLLENEQIDKKYEQERKLREEQMQKIKLIVSQYGLYEKINLIIVDCQSKNIENIFDGELITKLQNEFKTNIFNLIDQIFMDFVGLEGMEEESINDLKIELKEQIYNEFAQEFTRSIINKILSELSNALTEIFSRQLQDDSLAKDHNEKVHKKFNFNVVENDLIKFVNSECGIKLHDNLIQLLKGNV
ncbi:uncharacterized protein VNE69_08001 [Vairimorpha necatrix]|uniref:Uncharacterized protein n=1 Tax=Vairimorpha necatrix TaxID=6039 RepID=A0AAX4JEF9_9MICR